MNKIYAIHVGDNLLTDDSFREYCWDHDLYIDKPYLTISPTSRRDHIYSTIGPARGKLTYLKDSIYVRKHPVLVNALHIVEYVPEESG